MLSVWISWRFTTAFELLCLVSLCNASFSVLYNSATYQLKAFVHLPCHLKRPFGGLIDILECFFFPNRPCTIEELVQAVVEGESNRLLGEVHVALLRLLQADMEESHATGAIQVSHTTVLG
jgi:DDT domain